MKQQFLAVIDDITELLIRPFIAKLDTDRERFQWNVGKCSATISLAVVLLIVWFLQFPLPGKGNVITLSMLPAGDETMQVIELPMDQGSEEEEEQEEEEVQEEPEPIVEPEEVSQPEEVVADPQPVELPPVDHGELAAQAQQATTDAVNDSNQASATPPPGTGDPYNRSGGGLAQSNMFSGKTILIYTNCHYARDNVCGNPRLSKLLKWMGFDVVFRNGYFQPSWLRHTDQLWIFAGTADREAIGKNGYKAIEKYIRGGNPTYLCAENSPFVREVWVLGHRLMKQFKVGGSYEGGRLVKVDSDNPILTGIDTIYEGSTVAKFQVNLRQLQPLLQASNGDLLAAYSPPDQKWKLVIDGGWTRYYAQYMQGGTDTGAGTELYVTNLAAWLAGAKLDRSTARSENQRLSLASHTRSTFQSTQR